MLPPHHVAALFFFFNDPATTEIYTLSLHDALPIFWSDGSDAADLRAFLRVRAAALPVQRRLRRLPVDRKSTRLNSSHVEISYAVFCLKKKNKETHLLPLRLPEQALLDARTSAQRA